MPATKLKLVVVHVAHHTVIYLELLRALINDQFVVGTKDSTMLAAWTLHK